MLATALGATSPHTALGRPSTRRGPASGRDRGRRSRPCRHDDPEAGRGHRGHPPCSRARPTTLLGTAPARLAGESIGPGMGSGHPGRGRGDGPRASCRHGVSRGDPGGLERLLPLPFAGQSAGAGDGPIRAAARARLLAARDDRRTRGVGRCLASTRAAQSRRAIARRASVAAGGLEPRWSLADAPSGARRPDRLARRPAAGQDRVSPGPGWARVLAAGGGAGPRRRDLARRRLRSLAAGGRRGRVSRRGGADAGGSGRCRMAAGRGTHPGAWLDGLGRR